MWYDTYYMANFEIQSQFERIKQNLVETDTNVGTMVIYRNEHIVSKSLYYFGEYYDNLTEVICRYLSPESVFVDVGSNIGYHAVSVSQKAGCPVVAFEPHPSNFVLAAHNCHDKNIKIYHAGLSDVNGETTFNDLEHFSTASNENLEKNETSAPLVRLDELDIPFVTTMRIDVEKSPESIIRGGLNIINKFKPAIFYRAVEVDNFMPAYKLLDQMNYSQYWVTCMIKPNRDTFKNSEENPFDQLGISYILALPKEITQPTDLYPVTPFEDFNSCYKRLANYTLLF
jgi:FkbM family methyltransferase